MRVHQGRPDKWGAKDALDFSVPTLKMGRTFHGLQREHLEKVLPKFPWGSGQELVFTAAAGAEPGSSWKMHN